MMPFWIEIASAAQSEARITSAVNWLTDADLMLWMSEAVQLYQQECSPVKREVTITLDPNSTDGSYDLPVDYKSMDIITYAPPNVPSPYPQRVRIVNYDAFRRQEYFDQQGAPVSGGLSPQPNPPLPQMGGALYAAVSYNKLWLWPFRAIEGTVTLRNIPHRKPYSPMNTEEWDGYSDLGAAMETFGPDPEFAAVIIGIKNYTTAQILRKSPGGIRMNGAEYGIAMKSFEDLKNVLRRNSTDFASRTRPMYNAGGTR